MEVRALTDREAFGRAEVMRERAVQVTHHLASRDTWELGVSAMLSQLGVVTRPPSLVAKERAGETLSLKEQEALRCVPECGARLLERIPRLDGVALAVRYHKWNFNGSGYPPEGPEGPDIPLASRILRVVPDLVEIEDRRGSRVIAIEQLKLRKGYAPKVLNAVEELFGAQPVDPPRCSAHLDRTSRRDDPRP